MKSTGGFAVIIPAAGKSRRFGGPEKKTILSLRGLPVWAHSARLFAERDDVGQVVLVVSEEDRGLVESRFAKEIEQLGLSLATGGAERFQSVANAMHLIDSGVEFIAVHDAARPCLSTALIERVFAVAADFGAAMLAVPIADTVKRGNDAGQVVETIPREGLWLAQTPQVFRADWLRAAYVNFSASANAITDDAQLVEASGRVVHLVPSSITNLKITTPDDLALAEAILHSRGQAAKPS